MPVCPLPSTASTATSPRRRRLVLSALLTGRVAAAAAVHIISSIGWVPGMLSATDESDAVLAGNGRK